MENLKDSPDGEGFRPIVVTITYVGENTIADSSITFQKSVRICADLCGSVISRWLLRYRVDPISFQSYNSEAIGALEVPAGKEVDARARKPMRRMPWPAYLWPGLPQLARDGNWAALAVAVAAAVLLNAVLLGTCVWTEFVAPAPRIICWAFVGVAWTVSIGFWTWSDRQRAAALGASDGKTFEEALAEYLKGNWFEAERS